MAVLNLPISVRCILQADRNHETLYLTNIPIQLPRDGSDEHLVKVKCVSPCAGELTWAKTEGHLMDPHRVDIPCFDMTGTVVMAPSGSPFQPGTEIFTLTDGFSTGNARDYSIACTSQLAIRPSNLSWEEAATVSLSALTAYQALFEHGGLAVGWKDDAGRAANANKSVLITAAAGGVGSWAVQLAKVAGVGEIIAVNGTTNISLVRELGATQIVDYRKQSLGEWAAVNRTKVNLVIDMVGGQTLTDAWSLVKRGGIVVSVIERVPEAVKPANAADDIESKFFILKPSGHELSEMRMLLEAEKVKPIVDSVWDLDQYRMAFDKLATGHAVGKVVIRIS